MAIKKNPSKARSLSSFYDPNYNSKKDTLVYALGGLGEVGKNMYCFEHDDEIIIVDAGVKFPDDELLGIDYVIPDYTHLIKNKDKIKGLFITHGHEDHIGGIPFLLLVCPIEKIYAPKFAKALIEKKLSERKKLSRWPIIEINEDSVVETKHFKVEFYNTVHSIPDSLGMLITTPNGRIVETGDFKFDLTPTGKNTNYEKLVFFASQGVSLLMSDSTNSEVEGFSVSEQKVAQTIKEITTKTKGRLIVSTFASNLYRLASIIQSARDCGRKVCVFGRSMENVVEIGLRMKTINVPADTFVDSGKIATLPPEEVCMICTGSQGETLAALSRIANGTHKYIKIHPGDTVVFSSNPIPGNAISVSGTVDLLERRGANVLTNAVLNSLHTTGHASKEEQKLMIQLVRPKYFMPMHGEYKMLKIHAESGHACGIPEENIFICSNGDPLIMRNGEIIRSSGRIQTDAIYVDGNDFSGLSTSVIRDRQILSGSGMVACIVCIDSRYNTILCRPGIVSRGFVFVKENTAMFKEAEMLVYDALKQTMKNKVTFGDLKNCIRNTLEPFLYKKTNRNPIVIPVILNHKDDRKDSDVELDLKAIDKKHKPIHKKAED